jgi:hypothetical protein
MAIVGIVAIDGEVAIVAMAAGYCRPACFASACACRTPNQTRTRQTSRAGRVVDGGRRTGAGRAGGVEVERATTWTSVGLWSCRTSGFAAEAESRPGCRN